MKPRLFLVILLISVPFFTQGQNADIKLLEKVNGWDGRGMRHFSKFMSESQTYIALGVPVGVALYGLIADDREALGKAATVTFSLLGTVVLTQGIKYAVDRRRPYDKYPDRIVRRNDSDSPSFPSSHTSTAFSVATALSLEYPKWYVITPSMLWAAGVGVARMNQGVHYPSDVLGGAVLGAGTAYLCYRVNKWWNKKHITPETSVSVIQAYSWE